MGDRPGLKADYKLLNESKSNLTYIRKELEGIEKGRDALHDIWGSDAIAGKMDEFVNNWDDYRSGMLENVKDLGGRVEAAIRELDKLDADLAKKSKTKSGGN